MKNRILTTMLKALLIIIIVAGAASAETVTLDVPGTSNPWLAGMPNGTTADKGDIATNESPVLVAGVSITTNTVLSFSASGGVSLGNPDPVNPPDGSTNSGPHRIGAEHGVSDIIAPLDCLLGVFLDDNQPSLTPAPSRLDFSSPSSRSYDSLSPALKQVFFIGDGLDSTGGVQKVAVPAGATRLFLGTMDGYGWYDNMGSFRVIVTDDGTFPATLSIAAYAGITITGAVGRTFAVQYTASLPSTNWLTLTNIVLPSTPYLLFDATGPMSANRYYRAYELP